LEINWFRLAMANPLSPAKQRQNQLFLRELAHTGNVDEAARRTGLTKATLYRRRAAHPAFAQGWDAAQAAAQARLSRTGGRSAAPPAADRQASRTAGGEPVVVRAPGGRWQVRRSHPNKLTRASEQAFLTALAATANVALSAAAAGGSAEAFYRRRRQNPGFDREWRRALQRGYEAVEMALIESFTVRSHAHDAWQDNAPPAIPPMTPQQALQLLYLHQKEARLLAEPPHLKQRRGESSEAWAYRRAEMYRLGQARQREAFEIAEAARRAAGEPCLVDTRSTAPLPDLAQVTGWSRADPDKMPHDPARALFGGWRLKPATE
jgi:hypothetical protein